MYGKVTEFPVDCMLLYAEVDSRKCDCGHVTMVTILSSIKLSTECTNITEVE